jgi:regulator of sirC expression with transglutaminase-like and TPR domain
VQIVGQNPGSGVIIARQGQTYYVLTAAHVVATEDAYDIVTPDGKTYELDYKLVRKFPNNVDLAIIPFNSSRSYQVVAMGNSSNAREGSPVYAAGFPIQETKTAQNYYRFSDGEIVAQASRPLANGYALAYLNDTFAGMSGGPILDQQGQLIGIHGASKTAFGENQGVDPQTGIKVGLNLGIPIDTFLRSVTQVMPILQFPTAFPQAVVTQMTAADFFIRAVERAIAGDSKEALMTIDQAIRLQPTYASAYFARGTFRSNDLRGAIADYEQVIRLNPNFAGAYLNRGSARVALQDFRGAIADYDQVIRLNPEHNAAYYNRGNVRAALQDFRGAITDYDQAIRLNPNYAIAYTNRGNARSVLQDYRGAVADYEQTIRLNPNLALTYNNRGVARENLGDRNGAIADYQKAAELARIQKNNPAYELAIGNLRRLQQSQP